MFIAADAEPLRLCCSRYGSGREGLVPEHLVERVRAAVGRRPPGGLNPYSRVSQH
jgi:hypothetical protein